MKILIAEDDNVSRRLLEVTLRKWGYDVVVCPDGVSAWEVLQQPDAPHLAILDWMMPTMDGLEVCRRVRQHTSDSYVYLILLTARSQKEDLITGLEAGADDYLTKPFDAQELRMRLRAGQRILNLLEELIFAREALREQAQRDSLTRLCNRATVLTLLRKELLRAERLHRNGKPAPVSVVMLDLDHFKHINDTYGHLAGDAVLREAARRMREAIRPYDCLGRYGGEEFLLVFADCESAGAVALAERLRLAVSQDAMVLAEGQVSITLSAGIATSGATHEALVLVGAADTALYRAKRNGRNRIEIATTADIDASQALTTQTAAEDAGTSE
jgi:diguanylate cyclase (GGDEF)-like protein